MSFHAWDSVYSVYNHLTMLRIPQPAPETIGEKAGDITLRLWLSGYKARHCKRSRARNRYRYCFLYRGLCGGYERARVFWSWRGSGRAEVQAEGYEGWKEVLERRRVGQFRDMGGGLIRGLMGTHIRLCRYVSRWGNNTATALWGGELVDANEL